MVCHLGDGRWWDPDAKRCRDGKGRPLAAFGLVAEVKLAWWFTSSGEGSWLHAGSADCCAAAIARRAAHLAADRTA
jgi:hypothetical protein